MKVSRLVVLQFNNDLTEATRIVDVSYEYDGPVALAKKGRGQVEQQNQFQQGQAQQYGANAANSYGAANNYYQSLLSGSPGQMNTPSAAMYASDLQNINSTYNGLRQNAFANNAERGFGSAPSGFNQSSMNALNQGQANASTNAYNQGLINTANQRMAAAQGEQGLYGTSLQGELGNTNASNQSAFMRSQMGSTLGDILSGASSVIGGLSGIPGLVSSWGKMFGGGSSGGGGGSGVGNYGGGWTYS